MKSTVFGVVGALVGAMAGSFAYYWLMQQGFYALMLQGACIGWAASFAKSSSRAVPIAAGVIALVAAVFMEWKTFPFITDESFGYFLAHFFEVLPLHLLYIALGVVAAVWFPWNRYAAPAAERSRQT